FTVSPLNPGSYTVTAGYAGDAHCLPSSSGELSQSVTLISSAVTLTSSSNPNVAFSSTYFNATVACSGATPTGTLTFMVDGSPVGSPAMVGPGPGAWAVALSSGDHNVNVSYSGDG